MKGIIALFGGTFLIILMAATLGSINDFRATSTTATYDTTTGVGVTGANLTLSLSVLDSDLTNVTSLSSNNTADAPIASSYTAATKVVAVAGLNASDSRRLTVIYRAPSLNNYTGADLAAKWWPLILVIGIIAVITGAIVKSFQDKG